MEKLFSPNLQNHCLFLKGRKFQRTAYVLLGVISDNFQGFHPKLGATHKLLICSISNLVFGILDLLSGSGSGSSYSLTIRSRAAKDAATS